MYGNKTDSELSSGTILSHIQRGIDFVNAIDVLEKRKVIKAEVLRRYYQGQGQPMPQKAESQSQSQVQEQITKFSQGFKKGFENIRIVRLRFSENAAVNNSQNDQAQNALETEFDKLQSSSPVYPPTVDMEIEEADPETDQASNEPLSNASVRAN